MALVVLAILAFVLLFTPIKTEADFNYSFNSSFGVNNNSVPNPTPFYQYIYPPSIPAPTQTSVFNTPTIDSTTPTQTVARTTPTKTVTKTTTTVTETDKERGRYENLAANTIFGSIGFVPSGLFQWILFAILILLIVILTRRVFGGNKKFQETPLKKS